MTMERAGPGFRTTCDSPSVALLWLAVPSPDQNPREMKQLLRAYCTRAFRGH